MTRSRSDMPHHCATCRHHTYINPRYEANGWRGCEAPVAQWDSPRRAVTGMDSGERCAVWAGRESHEMTEEHPFEKLNREMCEKLGVGSCPFCGGAPRISGGDQSHWHITCASCNAMAALGLTGEDAAEAWNRRDPAAARIAELEGEVERLTRVVDAAKEVATCAGTMFPDVPEMLGGEIIKLSAAIRALIGESHDK